MYGGAQGYQFGGGGAGKGIALLAQEFGVEMRYEVIEIRICT